MGVVSVTFPIPQSASFEGFSPSGQIAALPSIHYVVPSKVRIVGSTSQSAFLAELQELANLPEGWDSGEGIPVRQDVVYTAKQLYRYFANPFCKVNLFPWADGSLTLVFCADERFVEINIYEGGMYDVDVEKGKGSNFEKVKHIPNASIEEVGIEIFRIIVEPGWDLSESSIQGITIKTGKGLTVRALPIRATEQEFRLSTQRAPWSAQGPSANILNAFTHT